MNLYKQRLQIVRTEPLVMAVSTTVVVTVLEIPRVTNRLVTVKGVANQDILTTTVAKVCLLFMKFFRF